MRARPNTPLFHVGLVAVLAGLAGCSERDDAQAFTPINTLGNDAGDTDGLFRLDVEVLDGIPENCGRREITAESLTPRLVLLLDESGSMFGQDWDHDGDTSTVPVTRWSVLHDTVDTLLMGAEDEMDFGAVLFPQPDTQTGCDVATEPTVAVQATARDAIMNAIPARDFRTEAGATPARGAVEAARDHLQTFMDDRPSAMVLITDGDANCTPGAVTEQEALAYDEGLVEVVETTYDDLGVPTFLIAVGFATDPVSQQRLTDLAEAGGAPKSDGDPFYSASSESNLDQALADVVARVSCTVALDVPAHGPGYTEIDVNGTRWPRLDDCAEGDGWRFTSSSAPYNTVEMCGEACIALQQTGVIDAEYTCPAEG